MQRGYYGRINFPRTAAHELLGHALEQMLAERAGLGWVLNMYVGDELNALVLGWLAEAETGGGTDDPYLAEFLADRDAFVRRLQLLSPGYIVNLTREEMGHPVETLRERLARVRAEVTDARRETEFEKLLTARIALFSSREDLRDALARDSRSPFFDEFDRTLEARVDRLRALVPAPPPGPAVARIAELRAATRPLAADVLPAEMDASIALAR